MYRSIPVGNKACAARIQKQKQDLHKRRLREMKVSVDTREPATCALDHVRVNLKKEQLLEERYFQIDRDNRNLLGKMSEIMRKPDKNKARGTSGPPSLNRDSRKTELERITRENQNILRRIQKAQPVYNHVAWNESYRRNVKFVKNCCEFPHILTAMRRSPSRGSDFDPLNTSKEEPLAGGAAKHPGHDPLASKDQPLQYVLNESRQIGDDYYMVEMATDGRTLTLAVSGGPDEGALELLINERNTRKLLREHNHDYGAIAGLLRVDGDQLTLHHASGIHDEGHSRPGHAP